MRLDDGNPSFYKDAKASNLNLSLVSLSLEQLGRLNGKTEKYY